MAILRSPRAGPKCNKRNFGGRAECMSCREFLWLAELFNALNWSSGTPPVSAMILVSALRPRAGWHNVPMCGRYELNESPQALALYFMLDMVAEPYCNAEVRPTNVAPIIRVHDGQRLALLARWGLIPSWSKDDRIAQHTFNARAETVADKPSFRAAFKRRRCIVPVSAFYEWQAIPGQKKKQKLRFASPADHPLALAGLWEHWRRPDSGEVVESFTVITISANAFMARIHDRMPVILAESDWGAWLDPDMKNPILLQSMLAPCPDNWLACDPA